ncbi:MAG: CPBP family intramembrane metalloprotease [Tidjanibacter sp.]|nr:CPBP family intramembrane metalloprotease [Tidjanibacter sp.]
MKHLTTNILVAAALWFVMFSPWTAPHLNFWGAMSCSAVILILLSFRWGGTRLHKEQITFTSTAIGVLSAALLWGIFWLGNYLATRWFGFAQEQVGNIYAMKDGNNPVLIATLLLILIGPAEEIFWRGFIQTRIQQNESLIPKRWPRFFGELVPVAITTLIYALVHIWSFNFMLVMAAMVCGGFWGLLYKFNKGNLWSLIVSHALWDAAVFIIFPIK